MTTLAKDGATVLPFTIAKQRPPRAKPDQHRERTDGPLPDNVIVLARFARRSRTGPRGWIGGPPEGEAA